MTHTADDTQTAHSQLVHRLKKDMGTKVLNLLHGAVGVSGEAGELLDAVKKNWVYEKPLHLENVIEELGDLEFYMEVLRQELYISREDVLLANLKKLGKRYPEGLYSNAQAIERADKTEEILKQAGFPSIRRTQDMSNETHEIREWNNQQDKKGNM